MLRKLWRFLVLLETAIPSGKGLHGEERHHNFVYKDGSMFLYLMLDILYVPIQFDESDFDKSPEVLLNDVLNIPYISERLKK